jgi:hypothetical protein
VPQFINRPLFRKGLREQECGPCNAGSLQ